MRRRALVPISARVAVSVALLTAPASARAQTACVTPNCAFAGTPAACLNRAAPRTPLVRMTTIAASFAFDPADPRIEPGDCIVWRSTTVQHSSSGSACADDVACGSPALPACQHDTGNVMSSAANPTSTCHYDPADFPAGTGEAYYCRIHASPTVGTMRGTLRVTTPIQLVVDKDVGAGAVKLSWTGGGVTGDVSYKVARNGAGDPSFPAATTTTANPDGGVLETTFTDAGELGVPATRYYLVRNKQTNEP